MATFIENAPEQICAAAKELLSKGLVEGTSGNLSARMEDGNIAVTPSSLDYTLMTVDDIVIVDPAGEVVRGERGPTSEKYLHLAVQAAYEDIAVCIHSHAVYATMFAVAHQDIPSCIDEFTVYLGGDIRCTEYAPSGSPDLAEQVVKALDSRGAALIANHGMVAVGTTMEKAMHNTALVERSAKIIWGGKQLGDIFPLPEKVNTNFANIYPYMR
ncbi:MAG TPA: class II aldolase/adducin family protein [Acidimicrobiales bacterium]|nr:class II aldolase/adducin family protein [Acidimicrobiales bacterium]